MTYKLSVLRPYLVLVVMVVNASSEFAIISCQSTLYKVWHHGVTLQTALPDCCLVVDSKVMHKETVSTMVEAVWTQPLPFWCS